jgi:hypothetical protein
MVERMRLGVTPTYEGDENEVALASTAVGPVRGSTDSRCDAILSELPLKRTSSAQGWTTGGDGETPATPMSAAHTSLSSR